MSTILADVSDDLAKTVETAAQSVVRVEARRRLPASGIMWSAEGVVVTANHVVERDDKLRVGLPSGDSVDAELAGRDPTTDLAVLRTEATVVAPLPLVEPSDIRVGNLVLALGRPGKNVQATLGMVSALGKSWRTGAGGAVDRYIQTDVVMYPGFSGGPLVDASGRGVGLNSSALMRGFNVALPVPTLRRVVDALLTHGRVSRGYLMYPGFSGGPLVDASGRGVGLNSSALMRGFNVALPVPTLRRVVDALLTHGRVSRGYLGVGAQPARLPQTVADQVGQESGLLVVSVEPGSPAEDAGILMGDTIVSVAGEAVRHMDDLLGFLSGDAVGKSVQVKIVHTGQTEEITVTVGERP